jgi:pyruvate formate lyase activating enzyme
VICGGEPTLHPSLIEWIKRIKSLGFRIKLDTNGTNPEMIKKILDEKLIDFIAIDFKGDLKNYKMITKKENIFYNKTIESIKLVLNSYLNEKKEYDIRTTIHSDLLSKEDILSIGETLIDMGVKKYSLQKFENNIILDKTIGKDNSQTFINELNDILSKKFETITLRNYI